MSKPKNEEGVGVTFYLTKAQAAELDQACSEQVKGTPAKCSRAAMALHIITAHLAARPRGKKAG